jgi:hypothetical protein
VHFNNSKNVLSVCGRKTFHRLTAIVRWLEPLSILNCFTSALAAVSTWISPHPLRSIEGQAIEVWHCSFSCFLRYRTNIYKPFAGIIFCFYNYARIATILRKHEEKVSTGEYPPLPELDDTILDLLIGMKPEVNLINSCLKKYAEIMEKLLPKNTESIPQPHLLYRFLSEVSHPVSRYYRTHHVLTVSSSNKLYWCLKLKMCSILQEPSPHLLKTMHARLHVIKAVHAVLQSLFRHICIEPPSSM